MSLKKFQMMWGKNLPSRLIVRLWLKGFISMAVLMKLTLSVFADDGMAEHPAETYDFLTGESAGWIVETR